MDDNSFILTRAVELLFIFLNVVGHLNACFLNDKYRYRYQYQRYWPCIYSVSDRYQKLQYGTPLAETIGYLELLAAP